MKRVENTDKKMEHHVGFMQAFKLFKCTGTFREYL